MTESVENTNVEATEEVVEASKALEEMSVLELCDFVEETAIEARRVFIALEGKEFETKSSIEKTVTAIRKNLTAIHSATPGVTKTISKALFEMKEPAKDACAANSAASKVMSIDEQIAELEKKKESILSAE